MHAAIYRARMTEDTFQILLDVMERHFAALSLPDPGIDPKITRAISFSELPLTRRILIEQCYRADDSGTLVRQYSCEQIFDKLSNSREVKVSEVVRTGSERCLSNTWRTTLPVLGALGNAGWHNGQFGQVTRAIERRKSNKMESMEVEEMDVEPLARRMAKKSGKKLPIMELNGITLSDCGDGRLVKASTFGNFEAGGRSDLSKPSVRSRSASPKKMTDRTIITESKFTENPKARDACEARESVCNEVTKKNLRSLIPEGAKNSRKSRFSCTCYKFLFFLLLSISAAILAIFLHDGDTTTRRKELDNLDIANMSMELRERIYGQERAIEELIRELGKSSTGINLMALIGSTGVGKSYTVGIVAKHFTPLKYIFEYFPPLRKTIHEALAALSRRHCNLIILENLRTTDSRDVAIFVKFMKEHAGEICVYTIAVFNPHETGNDLSRRLDFDKGLNEISSILRDLDDARVILFEDLNEPSLDACVRRAANDKNVDLSGEELIEIRENLMIAGSGCKGAYAKVQLLVES